MAVLFVQIGCTDLSLKYAQPHRFAEPFDVLWLCFNYSVVGVFVFVCRGVCLCVFI